MAGSHEQCSRTPDASLYVLGDLRGRQQESFARHLRGCAECADEVELLQQAADAVPLLASQQTPAEEPKVMQRVPTLAVAANNARAAASNARAAASDVGTLDAAGRQLPAGRPILRRIEGGASTERARPSSRRRLLKNPVPKPAMFGLLALAILAIVTVSLSSEGANVRYYRAQAGWTGGGAAVQLIGDRLRVLVEDMPKPASGNGYEVWVMDRDSKQLSPTGTWLHLNRLGQAGVTVPGDYHDWIAVAVYTEPLTGRDTIQSGAAVVADLRRL